MNTHTADTPPLHPTLRPLAPLIYVAWADGEMSDREVRLLRAHAETLAPAGDADATASLDAWLDPEAPPGTSQLLALLSAIRRTACDQPRSERGSLAKLGWHFARPGDGSDGAPPAEPELRALAELESALGLFGPEAARDLWPAAPPLAPGDQPAPSFDVARMTEALDGSFAGVRARVRQVLSDPLFTYRYDDFVEGHRQRVWAWTNRLASEGLGELAFPEATGVGGGYGQFIVVFETLAHFDLSLLVKVGVQVGLFGGSVYQLGTERHHDVIRRAARFELPGCFAMTELGHGSNVRELETTATYDPATETFVIHTPTPSAKKAWIGNAARDGRMATVFAQLRVGDDDHGVHAFLVPLRDDDESPLPGVTIEDQGHKMGLNGVDNGRLAFDQVRVPRANLLDRFATVAADGTYDSPIASPSRRFFTMLGTLVAGRVSVAAAGNAVAKSALTIALRYTARRRQFGPDDGAEVPVLDYPVQQRRLLPLLAKTYAIDAALDSLIEQFTATDLAEDSRALETRAAALKAYATEHASDTARVCREACGGQGYASINRFGSLITDSEVFRTFEGDNTVLRQLAARGILSELQSELGHNPVVGFARLLAGQAATTLAEKNPWITRRTGSDHLRDPELHATLLDARATEIRNGIAAELQRRARNDEGGFDAVMAVQQQLVDLAIAAADRDAYTAAAARLATVEDDGARTALQTLLALFALHTVESHAAWYLEHGYLEAAKLRAIRDEVTALCAEVRPDAVPLVDAFAIPDNCLGAPIAIDG